MEAGPYGSLSDYIDLLLDAICVVDTEGRYVHVSASFERIFGYAPEEVIGTRMIELVHPDDRELTLLTADGIMAGSPEYHFENRYVRKDGQVVHIMWSARWSEDHRLRIAVARDITRRKRAENIQAALYAISEATHAAEDLSTLFREIHRIIGVLLPASNFSIALYDEKSGEVSFPYHVDDRIPPPAPQQLNSDTLCAKVIRNGEALLLTQDDVAELAEHSGERSQARVGEHSRSWLGVPLKSQHGVIGALIVQSDAGNAHYTRNDQELLQFVSNQIAAAIERKQIIASLQHTALYDRLTQLPNRELFHDRIQLALARVRRDHVRLSLLYIDLDKFKDVNDTFGHGVGDLLLQKIARRLEECVRAGDTVARFGGDEFVVLLENIGVPEHTQLIIEKIRSALGKPFDLAGEKVSMVASIGVAQCPVDGDDEKQLLAHADAAMYLQKRRPG
jgi:diguanylate cyclase (GGDEF)-like protein/PAS domain S-box-containing protein